VFFCEMCVLKVLKDDGGGVWSLFATKLTASVDTFIDLGLPFPGSGGWCP